MRRECGVVEISLHNHARSANEHLANGLDVCLANTFVSHVQMYCVRGVYQSMATGVVVVDEASPIKSCSVMRWTGARI